MAGNQPKIKVAIKPKDGSGGRISLIAAWESNGKLSAQLDRRIVELAVKLDDGQVVRVKRGADGKPDHWIDVFDNSAAAAPPPQRRHEQASAPESDAFGDHDDDPLPFAIDATLYADGREARRGAAWRARLR